MRLIGLTGSIATGKSTTSTLLTSPPYNLPLIDADLLARRAVEPGTWGYRRILSTFASTTPDLLLPASHELCGGRENGKDGKGRPLNRPALGRRVFGDTDERKAARAKLNAIVHPAVRFYMVRALLYYYLRGHWAVVLDVPLLFESGLDIFCSTVLVVAVRDPEIQMRRLRERDPHLSEIEAKERVRSQTDVREKAERALRRNVAGNEEIVRKGQGSEGGMKGFVVYNDGSKQELELQVKDMMRKISQKSPAWWSWALLICPPLMVSVASWEVLVNWWRRRQAQRERGEELPRAKL